MRDDLTTTQKKSWAETLYLYHDATIKDIALQTGIDEADLRLWIKEGDWDGRKRGLLTSKQHQLDQLYELLEKVNQKMKEANDVNPKDADLAVKYTAAIKNLDTETGIAEVIEVAKLFTTWLRRKDQDMARTVALEFDGFIRHRLKPAY